MHEAKDIKKESLGEKKLQYIYYFTHEELKIQQTQQKRFVIKILIFYIFHI